MKDADKLHHLCRQNWSTKSGDLQFFSHFENFHRKKKHDWDINVWWKWTKGESKGKSKYFPVNTVKAYRWSRGIAPHFLTSEQMEVNCVLYGLATLAAGRNSQFLFNRRLDMPQSWYGHFGEELLKTNHLNKLKFKILLILQSVQSVFWKCCLWY